MELEISWKKFIESGSPLYYIQYSYLKQQKEKNYADNNERTCNKGDGYKG